MWPFRRRRHDAVGILRLGDVPDSDDAYDVYIVGETRLRDTYEQVLDAATDGEREAGRLHRWATLVRLVDPAVPTTAVVAVEFDGRRGGYLRPPHVDAVAARIESAGVAALEVPAVIEVAPSGFAVRLAIPPA